MRKASLLLGLILSLVLLLPVGALAQYVMVSFPTVVYYMTGAPCLTKIGGLDTLPVGGAFCWRTDTQQLYQWAGTANGWQLIPLGTGATLITPTITGGTLNNSTLNSPTINNATYPTGLSLMPSPSSATLLGNDLVIGSVSLNSVAPTGPNVRAATLRLRRSLKDQTACRLVIAGGNSFNQEVTITDPVPMGTLGCLATP